MEIQLTYAEDASAVGARADAELASVNSQLAAARADDSADDARIAELEAEVARLKAQQPTNPTTPPPAGFRITVTNVTQNSFRLNWFDPAAGTTGIYNGRNAGGGGTEQPWATPLAGDPLTPNYRDYQWLVSGKIYEVFAEERRTGGTRLVATVNLATGVITYGSTPTTPTTPPASTGDNKMGMMVFTDVNAKTVIDQDIARTLATGSSWIRIGIPEGDAGSISGLVWNPNVANMDYFVASVRKAKEAGLKVVLVMADTIRGSWSEADYRAIQAQYWKYVSVRLGQYVDLWQVFNEHDVRDYRTYAPIDRTQPFPTGYLERMRLALLQARTSIREGGSTAPVTTSPWGFPVNEALYTRWTQFFDGVGSSCDVIAIHAYPEKGLTTINLVTTFMNRLATRYTKKVAILEFGLPSVDYGTQEEVGAAVVAQIKAVKAVGANLLCGILYQLRNREAVVTGGEGAFGILNYDGSQKSYYTSVVNEIKAG